MWPAANFINFQFVPLQQRVAFASAVNLVWNVYLSYQAHKDIKEDGKPAAPRAH